MSLSLLQEMLQLDLRMYARCRRRAGPANPLPSHSSGSAPKRTARVLSPGPSVAVFDMSTDLGSCVSRTQALLQSLQGGHMSPSSLDHPGFPGSLPCWRPTRELCFAGDRLLGDRKAAGIARRGLQHSSSRISGRHLRLRLNPLWSHALLRSHTSVLRSLHLNWRLMQNAWEDGLPFTCEGLPLHVVHHEPDKVWVTAIEGPQPSDSWLKSFLSLVLNGFGNGCVSRGGC